MASKVRADLRADQFCLNRALPEIDWMCKQLGDNVAEDVMRRVEAQISNFGLTSKDRQWWIAKLRFLSRVTADHIWDATAKECSGIFQSQIDRQPGVPA